MKLKKRKKSNRMRGSRTHGWAMKKHKGSGNRGGKGFAGTGKRADQKKSYIIKYHFPYFGKQGFTSRATVKCKLKEINLEEIESSLHTLVRDGKAKISGSNVELNLQEYKILGNGEVSHKIIIKARAASSSALKKVENAGGKIILAGKKSVKTQ